MSVGNLFHVALDEFIFICEEREVEAGDGLALQHHRHGIKTRHLNQTDDHLHPLHRREGSRLTRQVGMKPVGDQPPAAGKVLVGGGEGLQTIGIEDCHVSIRGYLLRFDPDGRASRLRPALYTFTVTTFHDNEICSYLLTKLPFVPVANDGDNWMESAYLEHLKEHATDAPCSAVNQHCFV